LDKLLNEKFHLSTNIKVDEPINKGRSFKVKHFFELFILKGKNEIANVGHHHKVKGNLL